MNLPTHLKKLQDEPETKRNSITLDADRLPPVVSPVRSKENIAEPTIKNPEKQKRASVILRSIADLFGSKKEEPAKPKIQEIQKKRLSLFTSEPDLPTLTVPNPVYRSKPGNKKLDDIHETERAFQRAQERAYNQSSGQHGDASPTNPRHKSRSMGFFASSMW